MKFFLKKTVLLLFTFLSIILFSVLFTHLLKKNITDFKLNEDFKYLIVGNSRPECAFNDDLIDDFKNLSQGGEAYFTTYIKLKEVLKNNNINTVFIEFSNIDISNRVIENWMWAKEKANHFFPKYLPFMDKPDLLFIYNNQKKLFLQTITNSTVKNFNQLFSNQNNINSGAYGGYYFLERNIIKEELQTLKSDKEILNQNISIDNIKYLEKIVQLCNNNEVNIYFFRSPQYIPVHYILQSNENLLVNIRKEKFNKIEYLDFSNFPLKDNEYGDFDHLNHKGAKIFSEWFNKLIKKGLLKSDNKQDFISKEIGKI